MKARTRTTVLVTFIVGLGIVIGCSKDTGISSTSSEPTPTPFASKPAVAPQDFEDHATEAQLRKLRRRLDFYRGRLAVARSYIREYESEISLLEADIAGMRAALQTAEANQDFTTAQYLERRINEKMRRIGAVRTIIAGWRIQVRSIEIFISIIESEIAELEANNRDDQEQ